MAMAEAAAWEECLWGLCAWTAWHDLAQQLSALAGWDIPYSAEMMDAVVPRLLAAAKVCI